MTRSFQTDERHGNANLRPVRVPRGKLDIYAAARELCEDLGWEILGADEARLALRCRRRNGWLAGTSSIEVWVEGPDGIPTSTTHVRSSSSGGLLPKDRAIVEEFVRKFTMRVS